MQIVIDLEDLVYHQIKQHGEVSEFHELIIHGTPLPKGHGRIVDESKISKGTWNGKYLECNAPTIIEADGGDAE